MQAVDFLKRVLPESGLYCLAVLGEGGFRHAWFTDVAALATQATHVPQGDVYFAIASFAEQRRRRASARALRCFAFDIDVGKGGGYQTKYEALAALSALVDSKALPHPSFIVDSGGGFHIYWRLDRDVTVDEWLPRARHLKGRLKELDPKLAVDTARVADAAGVLRVPGTLNRKRGAAVQVVAAPGHTYSLDDFPADKLPQVAAAISRPAYIAGEYDGSLAAWPDEEVPSVRDLFNGCAQFRDAFRHQDKEGYDAWWCTIQLCAFTREGEAAAHAMSCRYPGYSEQETSEKYQQAARSRTEGVGPVTCERYAAARGREDLCRSCPFNGVSSPLVAARRLARRHAEKAAADTPAAPASTPGAQTQETLNPNAIAAKLSELAGVKFYFDAPTGKLRLRTEGATAGSIVDYDAAPRLMFVREVIDGDDPAAIIVELDESGTKIARERPVPLRAFGRTQQLSTVMEAFGYTLPRGSQHEKGYKAFIGALAAQVNETFARRSSVTRMGWTSKGFILGSTLITKNGTKDLVVPPSLQRVTDLFITRGDAQEQLRLVQRMFNLLTPHASLALLAALASPLMAFSGVNGLFIHLTGPSGSGKSTLLEIGSSFWGQPMAAHFTPYDTVAARETRLHIYHNLPALIDEVTPLLRDTDTAQKFIYAVTNGEGYHRARRDGSLQRPASGWRLISVTTANRSMRSAFGGGGEVDEALLLRILEMRIERSTLEKDEYLPEAQRLMAGLEEHYGHLGRMFIQHVLRRRDEVEQKVRRLTQEANAQYSQQYRFVNAGLACVEVAGGILAEMGVRVNMDLIRQIGDKLRNASKEVRRQIKEENSARKKAAAIVTWFSARAAVFRKADTNPMSVGSTADGWVLEATQRAGTMPEARLLMGDGWAKLIIPTFHLRRFVEQQFGVEYLSFMEELRNEGILANAGQPILCDYLDGVPDQSGNVTSHPPVECVAIVV